MNPLTYLKRIEFLWFWTVWVVGISWTSHTFAISIGPLHIGYWWWGNLKPDMERITTFL